MRNSEVTPLGEVWRIELSRGRRFLALGDFERAEAYFVRAYTRRPDQADVCLALGRERLRQDRHAEAEPLLRKALRRDPENVTAAVALARCLGIGLDRSFEAHRLLEDTLSRLPHEAQLHVARGELLLEDGRAADARTAFTLALESIRPDTPGHESARHAASLGLARAFNLEGIDLGREGRNEEALFAFKRASDLDPEWSGPVVNMGVAFAQIGRATRAEDCYAQALHKDPRNPVALFNLAHMARERCDLAQAEAGFQAALEVDADYPGVRMALAGVMLERGNPAGALSVLKEELASAPDDPDVWAMMAQAHDRAGDAENAESFFRSAVALDEEHVEALCGLARVLSRTGCHAEAQVLAARARLIDPELGPNDYPDLFPE